ncbi:MAG: hypothetical protein K0S67_634 [Nitrososphaeraceae archaeon]|jgi:hypothetical protein|nr:hypothetical protein [Nitrososphaeraceae archaeon]MCD6036750.1 hypothetical protein [Nitrososphaeraceae archaeon]MDF2769407.1 hypothetical protein [Nitrososphaeraceae archaeon]
MSVDVVAAKDNATIIEISTRLVLGVFNGMQQFLLFLLHGS